MTRKLAVTGLSIFLSLIQSHWTAGQGAAAISMGLEGATQVDGAGILHNPSTVAMQRTSSICIQHFNRFRVGNWNDLAIYGNMVTGTSTVVSAAYSLKGFPGFQTHSLGLATGIRCSKKMSLGTAAHLAKTQLIEKKSNINLEVNVNAGITYTVNTKTTYGLILQNPHRWLTNDLSNVSSAPRIIAGLQYKPSEIFSVSLEADHEKLFSGINIGMQYNPVENISCRIGYKGASKEMCGGVGIIYNLITIDAAVIHHPYLGVSTGITIAYCIPKS